MDAKKTTKKGGARPGAGRPKKPASEVRDALLAIRLTKAELAEIASKAGDKEPSSAAREVLLKWARR